MKTISIIILSVFLSSTLYSTELGWVDEQVNAIKPPRKGANISSIKSPFIFLQKNKPKSTGSKKSSFASAKKTLPTGVALSSVKKPTFLLSTVINSSAMINDAWYKKNDKVNGYTVIDIRKTSVTLKKGDKELTLSTNSKKQTLKFKNK
ncbi:hypothetical protein [Sulfurimonas sp.]|uniref:hypothetical protein n=1 Tax=Sulfurimonas sp. TaxID=2022749 RepID=UPI0026210AD0|nr:hypothetical protein [Sulfurimonas sp.]MCW8894261.1 hypothetical protein [Sulfurimonas sp.]